MHLIVFAARKGEGRFAFLVVERPSFRRTAGGEC
jgi:hypothetical protein